MERELAEDIRDMRARNAEATANARNAANYAAASEQAKADAAQLKHMRETAGERAAAQRALDDALARERFAQDRALQAMIQQGMLNEHRKMKLEELERLKNHPLPVAAPGTYTECDELASAPYDGTRPLGLIGVTQAQMNTGAAIASCREELAKHPDSARASFELARALMAAERCEDGELAAKEAILKGSAAAAVLIALMPASKCKAYAKPGEMEKFLQLASEMGSGDGAWILGKHYSDERRKLPNESPSDIAIWNKEKAAYERAFALLDPRAKQGDLDALNVEADLAHFTGSMILGYDSIRAQYRCVVTGYAPCQWLDVTGKP